MINPNTPGIPGMGAMTDTLEFVKNLWGGMGLPGMNMSNMNMPGMVVPTLSVEEIRKKVSDLKAVETWLELNMSMLRSTIQALEVQAATISTLQSMGDAFSATIASAGGTGQGAQPKPGGSFPFSSAGTEQKSAEGAEPTSKDQADAASLTAPLVNAAAWWNMLQDQFKQAVNTAMTEVPGTPASPAAPSKADTTSDTEAPPPAPSRKRRPSK